MQGVRECVDYSHEGVYISPCLGPEFRAVRGAPGKFLSIISRNSSANFSKISKKLCCVTAFKHRNVLTETGRTGCASSTGRCARDHGPQKERHAACNAAAAKTASPTYTPALRYNRYSATLIEDPPSPQLVYLGLQRDLRPLTGGLSMLHTRYLVRYVAGPRGRAPRAPK